MLSSANLDPKLTLNDYYSNLKPDSDYIQDVASVIQDAEKYMDKRIEEYKQLTAPTYKLAMVLDVDDTSLSHYPDFKYVNFANDLNVQRQRMIEAKAPAIIPVLNLYKKAIANNISVFFISARKPAPDYANEDLHPCTIKNLNAIGYKASNENLYLPVGENAKLAHAAFKANTRKMIEEKFGYKIILNLGDQPSDLEGGYAEKNCKLPNALYPDTLPDVFQSLVSKKIYSRKLALPKQNSDILSQTGIFKLPEKQEESNPRDCCKCLVM